MTAPYAEPFDMRSTMAAALEGLEKSASALREIAVQTYDGKAIADARAIAAEAQVLRMVLFPAGTILGIAGVVAALCDMTTEQILGSGRARDLVYARWMVMHLAHERGFSCSEIARALGMDHTSVRYGVAAVRERLAVRGVAA